LLALLTSACVSPLPGAGQDPEVLAAEASMRRDVDEFAWRTIGESVQGRPIRAQTIGRGPRRVLWIGGIHGNEPEGRIATEQLPVTLAAVPGALDRVTLTIVEDINPDGRALDIRTNANGVDLNRNFPAKNFKPHRMFGITPLSQPESRVLHDLVVELSPHLMIVAHSWRGSWFINYDGPARSFAQKFSELSGYPVQASEDISPTPGSLGSWVGIELGLPILTLEYLRGREVWEAWRETRDAILGVILSA
jgi:protein MpaA